MPGDNGLYSMHTFGIQDAYELERRRSGRQDTVNPHLINMFCEPGEPLTFDDLSCPRRPETGQRKASLRPVIVAAVVFWGAATIIGLTTL